MKKIIEFLESDETLLRAAMMLMGIYAVHNAYILHELEHFDLTISIGGSEYNFFKPMISIAAAFITEFVVLILFVKGERLFGHMYAVGLFALNTFYYCYFMPVKKTELIIVSVFVSFIHFAATWYLSDIFQKRRTEKLEKEKNIKPIQVRRSQPEKIDTDNSKFQDLFGGQQKPLDIPQIFKQHDEGGLTEKSHLLKIATKQDEYHCTICNIPFARKYTWQRHFINKHPELLENYKEAV